MELEEYILHGSRAQTFRGTLSGWTIKLFPYKKKVLFNDVPI